MCLCLWYRYPLVTKTKLLSSTSIVQIVDDDCTVCLLQTYSLPDVDYTKQDKPIAASYTFPLPDGSSVHFFVATFFDKENKKLFSIHTRAEPKQEAKETFAQGQANGKAVNLLEVEYKNNQEVFKVSLGNIPIDTATVEVEIRYNLAMTNESNSLYNVGLEGKARRNETKKLEIPLKFPSPNVYNLSAQDFYFNALETNETAYGMTMDIFQSQKMTILESPSHEISSELLDYGHKARVSISKKPKAESVQSSSALKIALKPIFLLKIKQTGAAPNSLIFQDPALIQDQISNDATMGERFKASFGAELCVPVRLSMYAPVPVMSKPKRTNVIFLVDRSASMSGIAIENVRKAISLCLSSLPEGSFFNICSFGSNFKFLFKANVKYTKKTLEKARQMVDKDLVANMGGTNVLEPIQEIIKLHIKSAQHAYGYNRKYTFETIVLLMTDGGVKNTGKVISTVEEAAKDHLFRVSTFGIGHSVSKDLVNKVATAGFGTATFLAQDERMNKKMTAQMGLAFQNAYANISFKLTDDGMKYLVMPISSEENVDGRDIWNIDEAMPKMLYFGEKFQVYGVFKADGLLRLTADLSSGNISDDTPLIQVFGNIAGMRNTSGTSSGNRHLLGEVLAQNVETTKANLLLGAVKQEVHRTEVIGKASEDQTKSEKRRATRLFLCANTVSQFTSLVGVSDHMVDIGIQNDAAIKFSPFEDILRVPVAQDFAATHHTQQARFMPASFMSAPTMTRPASAMARPASAGARPASAVARPAPAMTRPACAVARPTPAMARPASVGRPAPAGVNRGSYAWSSVEYMQVERRNIRFKAKRVMKEVAPPSPRMTAVLKTEKLLLNRKASEKMLMYRREEASPNVDLALADAPMAKMSLADLNKPIEMKGQPEPYSAVMEQRPVVMYFTELTDESQEYSYCIKERKVAIVDASQLGRLDSLVKLQEPSGAFGENSKGNVEKTFIAIAKLLKLNSSQMKKLSSAQVGVKTALVVLFFENELEELKDEWIMVYSKAKSWIEGLPNSAEEIYTAANDILLN